MRTHALLFLLKPLYISFFSVGVSVIASTPEDYVAEGTELEICAHLHFTNRLTSNDTVVVDIDFDDFANIFWSTAGKQY